MKRITSDGLIGSGKWQVSTEGGIYPVWSPAKKQLFYRSADRRVMVATYLEKSHSFVVEPAHHWGDRRLDLAAGLPSFDVSSDGSRVLGIFESGEEAAENHLRVLVNVTNFLKRR